MLDLPTFGHPGATPAAPVAKLPATVITTPGIYDLPADIYHADPCETPSLSAGMVNDLLKAPRRAQFASKRLNPDFEGEDDDRFTIGTVAHTIYLEPARFDATVMIVDTDSWRTKEAKAARANAKAAGKTPILAVHMDKVLAARASFLADEFARKAFVGGKVEQSLFWKHPEYGFWCRARPDFLHDSAMHMCDLKMTADADPNEFGRHAYSINYHRRAAWYLWGAEIALGIRPAHYWFINQEPKAPFLISVTELDWAALELGQEENELGCALFAECLKRNTWPSFGKFNKPAAFVASLPIYAFQNAERRIV